MATGDTDDMLRRQKAVLPRWFGDDTPVLDGVLTGFAIIAAHIHALLAYARLQTRLGTAIGGWLDLAAYDFFGLRFQRRPSEADDLWRQRIIGEILRPRGTRASIVAAVEAVTGRPPYLVFEPANPMDTGGYGVARGYGMGGRYGSLRLPHQMFIIPIRPLGQGIARVQGYQEEAGDAAIGAYGEGLARYTTFADIAGEVTDAHIYAAIESVRSAGTVVWTMPRSTPPEYFLDDNAILDAMELS